MKLVKTSTKGFELPKSEKIENYNAHCMYVSLCCMIVSNKRNAKTILDLDEPKLLFATLILDHISCKLKWGFKTLNFPLDVLKAKVHRKFKIASSRP